MSNAVRLSAKMLKPYPGWRWRFDKDGIAHHEPKFWARIVKHLTGHYPVEPRHVR